MADALNFEPSFAPATFVTDPQTGERLIVEHDDGYMAFIRDFNSGWCRHPMKEIFRFKVSSGAIQVRECCNGCGQAFGAALSQRDKKWLESLPWLPDNLSTNYVEEREIQRRMLLIELARKQHNERGAFTKSYAAYLISERWFAKRALVMKRCAGVCEGCGVKPAVEVHHHHYQHLFDEFLFELVGLCRDCHDRITLERRAQQEAALRERAAQVAKYGS
jgi:hypothetical protein